MSAPTDGRAVSFKPEIGIKAQRDSINRRQIFNYKRKPSALALHRLRATREDGVHSRQPLPSACTRFPLTPLNARLRDTDEKIRRPLPLVGHNFSFRYSPVPELIQSRVHERFHKAWTMITDECFNVSAKSFGWFLPRFRLFLIAH